LKPVPITIKEPYKPDVKEFADTDEFTHYFRSNEELFKEPAKSEDDTPKFLTTNKLNRTFKIPGYRIRIINKGKDNEELTLVKDYYARTSASTPNGASARWDKEEPLNDSINDTNSERIDEMATQITDILECLNNIETFLEQFKR
jgi:hypothetical protein